ncbi:4-hydroxy-2-oxovalerate aldolase [Aquiluna sp.]|nr:4-hydroxy-2-oxovalerate aldolase [Aquiluna sp.]
MKIDIHDVTLRDGNHALRHSLQASQVSEYCKIANDSVAEVIEVGHGNGLGASSYLVGKSSALDYDLLSAARESLTHRKLGVHIIPGFATFRRDVSVALDIGIDLYRVASHVTEADVCAPHIEKLADRQVIVHGVLMMSHMAELTQLAAEARKLVGYGAVGVIIMDSAGTYRPETVSQRVQVLRDALPEKIMIGFHAHNNLGFGLANAVAAARAGADILDGSSAGLGAGAGNVHLELLGAWLNQEGEIRSSDFEKFMQMAEYVEATFTDYLPKISSQSVRSGLAGAFSGYSPQVKMASLAHSIPAQDIWSEVARRKLVAGQESVIWEIAQDLANL